VFALEGNRIKEITDYASAADLYDTKEYYDRATATDIPDMLYDANGNLKCDLDRNIDSIKYNIYNLPDTVIFSNGNKIINHYTASGNKWKTEYHTIIDAMYLPNTADGTVFDGNLVDIHYTIYDGNIEYKYIVNSMGVDSLYEYVIHNTEGYIASYPQNNTMTQYYYHQDHLGNICAVWDATHDSVVQQTLYYASGLPVSVSTGQDVQPYKYNGKEYVEMHGYDVYEYGARGYYATIGRFTSIDPLCEQTPWQSPYVYANNNWVNNIDWMGMMGTGFQQGGLNLTIVDSDYKVVCHIDNGNPGVYMLDEGEEFNKNKIDWGILNLIGIELPYINYHYGRTCLYLSIDLLPNHEFSFAIKSGKYYATFSEVKAYFETAPSYISALFSIADELLQGKITKLLPKYAKAIPYIYPIIQTINIKNLELMDLMLLPLSYIPGASWFLIYAEFVVPICAQAMTEIHYSADLKLKDAIITGYFPDVSPEFLQIFH
jgi:RHS repeat-associated protein